MPRVLIAEADAGLAEQYRLELHRGGFEVSTASEVGECVRRLEAVRPDVLVFDPALPGISGESLFLRLADPDFTAKSVIVLCSRPLSGRKPISASRLIGLLCRLTDPAEGFQS